MPVFRRRGAAPEVGGRGYSRYREAVREDFAGCCSYCLLHELLAGGPENFEIDHHRPKSLDRFRHLLDDFFNLFYSCHPCNRIKSNHWPSQELLQKGFRFIDYSSESFSEHFIETESGRWLPLSRSGRYSERQLRLNRRHLLEIRALLRDIAALQGKDPIDWNYPCRDQLQVLLPSG